MDAEEQFRVVLQADAGSAKAVGKVFIYKYEVYLEHGDQGKMMGVERNYERGISGTGASLLRPSRALFSAKSEVPFEMDVSPVKNMQQVFR